jgi:hypothetical protein
MAGGVETGSRNDNSNSNKSGGQRGGKILRKKQRGPEGNVPRRNAVRITDQYKLTFIDTYIHTYSTCIHIVYAYKGKKLVADQPIHTNANENL